MSQERRFAAVSVTLMSVSGVLEGTAILLLVPILSQGGVRNGGRFTTLLEDLGFHGRAVAWAAVGSFVLASVAAAASKFAAEAMGAMVRVRVEARLRKELTECLLGMEWSRFVMMRFGEMTGSLMMESSQIGAGVQQSITAIGSIVVTAVYVALALLLSVSLTFVVVGFAIVGLLVLRPINHRVEHLTRSLAKATTDVATQITDVLGNLKFFRSTGSQSRARDMFSNRYDQYATSFQGTLVSPFTADLLYNLSALIFIAALLIVSLHNAPSLSATALAFFAIFLRLLPRVQGLQSGIVRARLQFPWLIRWKERFADAAAHQSQLGGTMAPFFCQSLRFDGVSFAYPETNITVLDDVSWEVKPGEVIAFVGESGAGKSTMLDLITGLLVPTQGRILVDGVSLRDIDTEAWQSHIGLVLQDTPLFHCSVHENIVGDRPSENELVWESLAAAHAERFVEELPAGIDTVIGERGGRLSGGQRQRLGLARALYRQPWLLVLDEATNALDSVSEQVVLEALRGLKGRVAMIMVAHRLATVEMADRIYVIDAGHIVQSGSWTELMSDPSGSFAIMAGKQGIVTSRV